MAEAAAAYGSGDTQICRHSAQDRRRSDSDTDALCSWAWKWMRCADRAFGSSVQKFSPRRIYKSP